MTRKLSKLIAAGAGALSLLAGAAVYADDAPLSVNESGPMSANHERAPTESSPAVGRSDRQLQTREIRGSIYSNVNDARSFEVQTPSSLNESAPWLTGQERR